MNSADAPINAYDFIVIGAGPAGLQTAYTLNSLGFSYVVLDREEAAGSFFADYPRHRTLLSINKVFTGTDDAEFNLRMDWNSLLSDDPDACFKNFSQDYFPSSDDLVDYLRDFSERHGLNIRYKFTVERVRRSNAGFEVEGESGAILRAKNVVVATGLAIPMIPDIPGIELAEQYSEFSIDPKDFENQRVLIIGKGNSAFETAENLIGTTASVHLCSPNPIRHAWQSHFVGHLRAVNNNVLDTYMLKSQNTILDAEIQRIYMQDGKPHIDIEYTHSNLKGGDREPRTILFDRVLCCTGFRFDDRIFEASARPETTECGKFPLQTAEFESVNVPGMYFTGCLMAERDFKKTMSAFIHGFRHNITSLGNIWNWKERGVAFPSESLPREPGALTRWLLDRLDRGPSIFLQPGFIADGLQILPSGEVNYYKDLFVDHAREHFRDVPGNFYLVSLEYGDCTDIGDPFAIARSADPADAPRSFFLHPIFRRIEEGQCVDSFHLLEDLENVYSRENFAGELEAFIKKELIRAESQLAN